MHEIQKSDERHDAAQRETSRQTETSGFQAISEFHRSQKEAAATDLEKHVATGKERGNMRRLEDALLGGTSPEAVANRKRSFANTRAKQLHVATI